VLQIRFLADTPEHVDQLADWHHAQWQHLYTDWTHEVAKAELLEHAKSRTLPATLVLTEDDMLQGSVSLMETDADALAHIGSPWLASLFVKPEARGKGHGARLVKSMMQHAENIALKELFLFTPEHKSFYEQQGWKAFHQAQLNNQAVDVLRYQITGPKA